jgi:hypothetical protein
MSMADDRADVDVGKEGDLVADVVSAPVERQTRTSGAMPIRRSSLTECCVGFVFSCRRSR